MNFHYGWVYGAYTCLSSISFDSQLMLISGKAWGKPSDRHVLAIHGMQDNCGVFDRLISMLDGHYYIVAIDLPGHGFSTHFPAGLPLSFLNFVLAIAYVVKELSWDKFLYLSHSLGGQIGAFFTALFPHYIEKLVIIDHILPRSHSPGQLTAAISDYMRSFMSLEKRLKNGTPPTYSYDQVLEKLTNRDSVLTTEAAKIVLERSLIKMPGGYSFCMDQRMKLPFFPTLTVELAKEVYVNIKCPTLILLSSARINTYREIFEKVFEIIDKKANITVKVVPGNHDLHQNHPERVYKLIDDFFSSEQCKL